MNQTNTSKRIPTQINEFRGDYAFLSNFYPAPVSYMGQTYANNEAAFQAQKTLSAREQRKFCIFRMHNPSDAKKLGRDLTLRPGWEKVKVRFMYEICMCKFMQNPELRDKLLATGESTLIEGNNWGDYFWGKVNNCGENQLGIILMDVRAKLQWNAKTKLVLEYTGMDDFSCPVYKDQFGKLWKDIDLGKEPEPNLYSLSFNHIDGEPSHPIQQEYTFHPAPYQRSSYEFEYRMLSKLQSDCEYYLGYGNRSPSILCNHSVQNHIARMKELWNGFPTDQKPEWLTWEQLLQYEKVMTETGIPVKNCSD